MKLTRDKLRQIIKEELEEIMSVSEADVNVSVSPESLPQPLTPSQEREITSSTSSKAFEMQGKRYIAVLLPNGTIRVYSSNTDLLKFYRGERDSEGKKIPEQSILVQEPNVISQANNMFPKKPTRRR
jgi:hypothetical protein